MPPFLIGPPKADGSGRAVKDKAENCGTGEDPIPDPAGYD